MKFQSTIIFSTERNLYAAGLAGKLHTGQWVKLPSGLKGQYIGICEISGVLWMVWHREGESFKARTDRLCRQADAFKCRRSIPIVA